jgi:hypothetical protein
MTVFGGWEQHLAQVGLEPALLNFPLSTTFHVIWRTVLRAEMDVGAGTRLRGNTKFTPIRSEISLRKTHSQNPLPRLIPASRPPPPENSAPENSLLRNPLRKTTPRISLSNPY